MAAANQVFETITQTSVALLLFFVLIIGGSFGWSISELAVVLAVSRLPIMGSAIANALLDPLITPRICCYAPDGSSC